MKKFNKIMSLVLTLMFMVTLVPRINMKVKAEEVQAVDTVVTLTGSFLEANGLGSNWKENSETTIMKEYKDGIYELVVDFKTAGDYEYKVTINRTWNESYPSGNKILKISNPGKVIFRFNNKTKELFDSSNDKDKFKETATLVGSLAKTGGQDWNPADANFDLNYAGGGFFKKALALKAGSYEYKVAYDHKWSNGEVGGNVTLILDKDQDVTFLANPITGVCTDSIANPEIAETVSLIGSIRGGNGDWDEKLKGYEFSDISDNGKYVYSGLFKKGEYDYKVVENYSWNGGGIPSSNNQHISISDEAKYVVFVCDAKAKTVYDSINNPDKVGEALGLKVVQQQITNPTINANGTVTFKYENSNAKEVYLAGSMTDWQNSKRAMTKDANGIWSITIRLDDKACEYQYKFIVDGNWITDPANTNMKDGNSVFTLPEYTGRKVVLAGTIQAVAGAGNWDAGSDKTTLKYDGNGLYSIVIPNVPAGNYEYKVAMGSWSENYGQGAARDGANIPLTVAKDQDVKFIYSDDSHNIVDSTTYIVVNASLEGTVVPAGTVLKDESLSGVYSAKVKLNKGTYTDLRVVIGDKKIDVGTIDISEDNKIVTISYDSATGIVFNDAANKTIALEKLYFNSRETEYKAPYGAVKADSNVTFNLKAAKGDLTQAKIVLVTPAGLKTLDMSKNGTFDTDKNNEYDRWTVEYAAKEIGMYKYYFVVSNGSSVKAYGDDDGYFGQGKADDLGKVKQYDLNVYDKNFKTPDWMKNGVVYQIFPDRFFNGDESNDYLQKLARGTTPYEFYTNWYAAPEDPELEFVNGQPNPDYTGTKGDGVWCNEMYGGDLKGIQAKLNYLQALGVNVLYLNPASKSISSHRYDTTDYMEVDPLLGHTEDFVNLATEAHKRGMHLILDGVFNHVSDDSVYFDRYNKYMAKGKPLGAYQYWSRVYDLMNLEKLSQQDAEVKVTADLATQGITDLHYKDWFKINNKIVDEGKTTQHYDYEGWWGYDSMPVIQALNGSEYNVKSWDDEIIDGKDANSRYWLRQGSNGWRLDVANEVSDETWRHFRNAVKEEGDNVIIGEIWTDASKYLLGDMYDSVMNYRFRGAVLNYVRGTDEDGKTISAVQSMNELESMREQYPKEAFEAMLNLMDSHDTQRVISALDGYKKSQKAVAKDPSEEALAKMKMIPLFQMTYPGAPCIYYGDEAGMPGADDPDNRRGMIWGKGNEELVKWYAELANIRNAYPVLRTGDIVPVNVLSSSDDIMAYLRNDNNNHALVAINRKTEDIKGLQLDASTIPNGTELTNALNPTEKYTVVDGKVTVNIPKQLGIILVASYKAITVNTEALKDAYDPSYIVKDKVRATGISLNKEKAELKVGESLELKAGIMPENTTLKNVTWKSMDEKIAKVDANGKVTAISDGKVIITATTLDGDFTANCEIKVYNETAPTGIGSNNGGSSTKLPKTGSPIDTDLLLVIGIALVGTGSRFTMRKKRIN